MKSKVIPGFKAFFGNNKYTYEDVLRDIPSATVISIAATLLNEIDAPVEWGGNQRRILLSLLPGYSPAEAGDFMYRVMCLVHSPYGDAACEFFERTYLHALIVRELGRGFAPNQLSGASRSEFPILLALLMVIDEVHAQNQPLIDDLKNRSQPVDNRLEYVWPGAIKNFQHNERLIPFYEFFKMHCLLDFVRRQWPQALREYLHSLDMRCPAELGHSFKLVIDATEGYKPTQRLTKLSPIIPDDRVSRKHLDSLCINPVIGKVGASRLDIKVRPLFCDGDNQYRIIDKQTLFKKMYRGSYFELQRVVFPGSKRSNAFSSRVGKEVIEEKVFRSIIDALPTSDGSRPIFSSQDGAPDVLVGAEPMFLFELKANILKDSIVENPSYDEIKKYLDENFVFSTKEQKPVGVGQLAAQVTKLRTGEFSFGKHIPLAKAGTLTVYPILSYDDFHFGMVGFNDYLHRRFMERVTEDDRKHFNIRPLTLVHLQLISDLLFRGLGFANLAKLIEDYHIHLRWARQQFDQFPNETNYYRSIASFDEVYVQLIRRRGAGIVQSTDILNQVLASAGITNETLLAKV